MPYIEVSVGELIDKWTVLQIKQRLLKEPGQNLNVSAELEALRSQVDECLQLSDVLLLAGNLTETNVLIWHDMEELDALSQLEDPVSDERFANLARRVTLLNRERALLKRAINDASRSRLREEKHYFGHPVE